VSEIIKPSERISSSHQFAFLTTENISSHGTNKNLSFKSAFSIGKVPCWHFSECNKVKQSRYRPGVAQRVPGSYGSQIS
jgi:hypothetical protein